MMCSSQCRQLNQQWGWRKGFWRGCWRTENEGCGAWSRELAFTPAKTKILSHEGRPDRERWHGEMTFNWGTRSPTFTGAVSLVVTSAKFRSPSGDAQPLTFVIHTGMNTFEVSAALGVLVLESTHCSPLSLSPMCVQCARVYCVYIILDEITDKIQMNKQCCVRVTAVERTNTFLLFVDSCIHVATWHTSHTLWHVQKKTSERRTL